MANSLMAGSPVLMAGKDKNNNGHVWVATEVNIQSIIVHYDVYNFKGRKSYEYIGTCLEEHLTYYYFRYNWGDGAWGNGYYFYPTAIDYNKDMKALYNIKPK